MGNDVNIAPIKLKLLITVVNKGKSEFYCDYLAQFGSNLQMSVRGRGSVNNEVLKILGLKDNKKSVIFSVIQASRTQDILEGLSEKFETVDNGKGIAFTVPFDSTIGVLAYRFLSDFRGE